MTNQTGIGTLGFVGLFLGTVVVLIGLLYLWLRPEPKIVLMWAVAGLGGAIIPALLMSGWNRQAESEQNLRRDGVRGVATVVRAQGTNMMVQRKPQVRLLLRIELPGRETYEHEYLELVPMGQAVTPGRRFTVHVDPGDPNKILLDWAGAAPEPVTDQPPKAAGNTLADRMSQLEEARQQGLISDSEYRAQRERLLSEH